MIPSEAIANIKAKLPELYALDFGYPLGENSIHYPKDRKELPDTFTTIQGAKWLTEFYRACDGLSLPDVRSGYFIKPLAKLLSQDLSSEPDKIVGNKEIAVLPFGSTGNGTLFVVDCQQGRVLKLSPGLMRGGRYDELAGKVTEVAASVPEFVERLYHDLEAFINGNDQHPFLA